VRGSGTVKLEIPCSPQFVSVARKAVEAIAFGLRLPNEVTDDLRLAVGEACTNAVKYTDPSGSPILVLYRISPDAIEIKVHNKGREFRREKKPAKPTAHELPVGGLGFYVVEQVMDEVDVVSKGGETVVRMVKRLSR